MHPNYCSGKKERLTSLCALKSGSTKTDSQQSIKLQLYLVVTFVQTAKNRQRRMETAPLLPPPHVQHTDKNIENCCIEMLFLLSGRRTGAKDRNLLQRADVVMEWKWF